MKSLKTLSILMLAIPAISMASPAPAVVTLKPMAAVSADTFTLAEIADIKAPAQEAATLGAAAIGRSPLDGLTRTITLGDICLKLRQAGFDPSNIKFAGPQSLTVSSESTQATTNQVNATTASHVVTAPVSVPATSPAASNAAIAPVKLATVKAGDPVNVIYVDGPVTINVQGALLANAVIGDIVSVRTSFSTRVLKGKLVDSQTVRL